MRWLLLLVALCLLPAPMRAGIITVDCQGGGDYTTLPEGVWYATASDTVLVQPCTYEVEPPWWPITLDADSPTIVGVGGASVTIFQGDGTTSAFQVDDGVHDARIEIVGLTFRNVSEVIDKTDPYSGGYITFTDNVIEECGYGLDASSSGGLIAHNTIRGNDGTGIGVYHCWATVEHNEICYNDRGINGACCEEPQIGHNHIHHNTEYGIRTGFYGHIHDNIIEYNGGPGVYIYGAGGELEHNIIRRNSDGVWVIAYCQFAFHSNDIYDNDTYAVVTYQGASACNLDATMNWWGTTDQAVIEASILDCSDDPGRPMCVLFSPWCEAPGCETTSVEHLSWGSIKALFRDTSGEGAEPN